MSLLGLFRGDDEVRYAGDSWDIPWGSPMTGSTVNEVTAFNLSAVWACETLIADSIATMPVDVLRDTDGFPEEITRPSWIDYPNPDELRVDFDTQRVLSLLGWGNAYVFLYRRGGGSDPRSPVVGRKVLDPWSVNVRRDGGELVYEVSGVRVPAGNVQHIVGYKRPGDVKGMSVIQNAAAGLSASSEAEKVTAKLYENGLNPSGVLEVPQMPAETQSGVIERLRENFQKWYGGSRNAGKPMVLAGGTTWKQMAVTPVDAQFLETRRFQVEEVARWFRVPLHKIQHLDKTTSWGSGIEEQSLDFVRSTLLPWLVRLEQADSLLLPRPQYVKYNVNSLVRGDMKTRFEAYKMAREGGWASVNDILRLEDGRPIPNGDVYLQPLNYIEAGTEQPGTNPTPGDTNGSQ